MADESGPFEVEPPREPEGGPRDASRPSDPASRRPRARLEAESLLEGFDEDADFESDPEVEAAIAAADTRPKKRDRSDEAEFGDPSRWLIRPGFPSARVSIIAGGVLTLLAVIFAIVAHAEERWWLHGLVMLYATALNTLLGLFALVSASYFSERGLNEPGLGLARVFVAVAGAMVALGLALPYGLSILLAGGIYYLLVLACFRLPRYETGVLALSHFGLWLLVQVGIELGALTLAGQAPA